MDHMVSLSIGDPSNDGHGWEQMFTLKSNYSQREIMEAFATAIARGVPDIRQQCEEYEDRCFTTEFVEEWLRLAHTTMPELKVLCDEIYSGGFFSENRGCNSGDDPAEEAVAKRIADEYGMNYADREKYVDTETFADVYMFTASTVLTDLKFEPANKSSPIYIGGYGLFSS